MNFLELQGVIGLTGFLVGLGYVMYKRSKTDKQ